MPTSNENKDDKSLMFFLGRLEGKVEAIQDAISKLKDYPERLAALESSDKAQSKKLEVIDDHIDKLNIISNKTLIIWGIGVAVGIAVINQLVENLKIF